MRWRDIHIHGTTVMLCLLCNRYSANHHNRDKRYCGFCHVFLEDIPMDFHPHPVTPLHKPSTPSGVTDEVPEWQTPPPGQLRRHGYHLRRRT